MWDLENIKKLPVLYKVQFTPVFNTQPILQINYSNVLNIDNNILRIEPLTFKKLTFNSKPLYRIKNYFFKYFKLEGSFLTNYVINDDTRNWYYTSNILENSKILAPLYYVLDNIGVEIEVTLNGINNYSQIEHLLLSNDIKDIYLENFRVSKQYLQIAKFENSILRIIYYLNPNNCYLETFDVMNCLYLPFIESLDTSDLLNVNHITLNNKIYSRISNLDESSNENFILSKKGALIIL